MKSISPGHGARALTAASVGSFGEAAVVLRAEHLTYDADDDASR